MSDSVLDEMKTDALGEAYNVAMGSAASAVSGMIDSTVSITAPVVNVCKAGEVVRTKLKQSVKGILFNKGEECVYVKIKFKKGIKGTSLMVFNREDIQMLVSKLMGMPMEPDDDFEFDEMSLSAVTELMNQMMGAAATSLSQFLNTAVEIAPPEAVVSDETKTLYKMLGIASADTVCAISHDFEADNAFDSRFITLLPIELASEIANILTGGGEDEEDEYDEDDEEEYEDEEPDDDDEDDEEEDEPEEDEEEPKDDYFASDSENLSEEKRDAIGEIQNIMMGSSATALSNFMNAKVWITTPRVEVMKAGNFDFEELDPSICVKIKYIKGIHGASILVLKQSDVQMMVNQLMGLPPVLSDDFEFNEMNISAVCEIMNQMMGASATTLSEIIATPTDISTPEAIVIDSIDDILKINNINSNDKVCAVSFDLTIDNVISSHFVTMLSIDLANEMADKVMKSYSSELENYSDKSAKEAKEKEKKSKREKPEKKKAEPKKEEAPKKESKPENAAKPKPAKPAASPKPQTSSVLSGGTSAAKTLNVEEFHMNSLEDENEIDGRSFLTEKQYKNLRSLLDVPMEVSVRIGSTQKSIDEVGNFTRGTIIELDTLANEPVDIMVNGNLIAKGDVVVVDDNFAVRITEIIK